MHRQQGVTLISLLIGLLVSTVVLIGMLVIFRNVIQTVVPASEDARSDGERVSGVLAAQIMLQDAGFGIESAPAYGTHLRVLVGATQSNGAVNGGIQATSDQTGNAVVWRKRVDDNDRCEGLFADRDGGLWHIVANSTCNSIDAGLNGTATPLIQQSRHPDGAVAPITFAYTELAPSKECRPFGIGTGVAGKITVTIAIENSTGHLIESTTCLANFL
ncbi:MAG: hypothetical protein WC965_13670 [Thiohalomonadaceae bacterium]